MANGIPASRGIGIGSICVIEEHELKYEAIKVEDTEKEQKRFQEAIEQFKKECIDYATRESYVTAKLVFLANMIKHNTKSSKELLEVIQGDPEVVSLFSEKELFNKTTLEMLPISEMEKDSQYNSHLKFFKETNLAFNNMKKCLDEDAK